MGPRLCSRGERVEGAAHVLVPVRSQWGHGFVAVESSGGPPGPRGDPVAMGPRLCSRGEPWDGPGAVARAPSQWGHGFVAVESCPRRRRPARPYSRNGATAL